MEELLKSHNPLSKVGAVGVLGELGAGGYAASGPLMKLLTDDANDSDELRAAVTEALIKIGQGVKGNPKQVDALVERLVQKLGDAGLRYEPPPSRPCTGSIRGRRRKPSPPWLLP